MSEQMMYLTAVVGADATQFRRTMSQVRDDVGILSNTIGGISGAARSMTYAFSAPMVALGTLAVNAASQFDASMRNINSILGLNEEGFASLSKEAFDFAKTTRDGVVPATEALYEIFSAGITDQDKAMALWKVSTKVAEAGVADLSSTTNALTATMNAFNMTQEDSERIGNVWTRMVQVGVGSMDDFLSNAQKILPLSNLLGVSLEDMGASVAFLSQGGGGAAKAETAFAMMMSNLLKPTEAMTEAFDKLGVKTGRELLGKFKSVGAAVQALKGVADETMFNKMFSKTGLEAAGMMTTNASKLAESITAFNDSLDTATMDAWTEQSKSFAFQFDLLKTALQGVATVIGQAIIPIITPMITGLTDILSAVSDTNPQLVQMGVIFVGLVAAAAPVIWLLTSLLNPIGLVVGAIGALAVAFTTDFGGIRTQLEQDIGGILGTLQPLKDGIQTFIDTLFGNEAVEEPNIVPSQISPEDFITINPKGGAISLWSFFEGEGFIEEFSWDEFQKMARDAGWDGTAIEPGEVLKLLTPNGGTGQDMTDSWLKGILPEPTTLKEEMQNKMKSAFENWTEDNSVGGRIAAAFEEAWPKIEPALKTIWTNVQNWFSTTFIPGLNTIGGQVISAIAGLFNGAGSTGKGDTQIYKNLTGVFNNGAAVADGVSEDFQKNFPAVANALTMLFSNIEGWIKNEGVPTIARGIGFLAGQISVLIGTALGSIWSSISGGQTAAGVGQATSVVQTSFMTPMNEGFQEALKGQGVTNPTDAFFTNLSALLVAGAIAWKIAPDFATNILSTIVKSLVGKLGVATAFSTVGTAITTSIGSAISASMAGGMLGNAWLNLAILKQTIGTALTTAIGGVTLPALALTVGAVALSILAFKLLVDENARNEAHLALTGILDSIFGDDFTQGIEDRFTLGIYAALAGVAQVAADILKLTGQSPAVQKMWEEKAALWGSWAKDAATNVLNPDGNGLEVSTPLTVTITEVKTFDVPTAPPIGVQPTINPWTAALPKFEPSMLVPSDTGTLVVGELTKQVNEAVIPPEGMTEFTANMEGVLNEAIATGNFDGQAIVDRLIVPLSTGFTTNFGAESAAALAWNSFVTSITTAGTDIDAKFILLSQDLVLLATDAITNMPIFKTAVLGAMNPIIQALNDANFIAKNLSSTLSALDGSTVTVTTSVAGGIAVDGTHKTGLESVPYDGYIAELHKGEKVMTKEEVQQADSRSVAPKAQMATNNGTTIINNVNITGVNDLDGMLKEARRRGIPLGKR